MLRWNVSREHLLSEIIVLPLAWTGAAVCCLWFEGCWWKKVLVFVMNANDPPSNFLPVLKNPRGPFTIEPQVEVQDGAKANACQLLSLHVKACTSSQHTSPADRTLMCHLHCRYLCSTPHLQHCQVVKSAAFLCIKAHPTSPSRHHTWL